MNDFGKLFKVGIFGESHQTSVGVLIDGIPAGIPLSVDDFLYDITRRKPQNSSETARIEDDLPLIESGLFNDHTTGAPMLIRFLNQNIRSNDYESLNNQPRPGHADFTTKVKFNGYNDYRGGGHTSGRVTLGLVAAGVIAKKIIPFTFKTELVSLGTLSSLEKKDEYLEQIAQNGDSVGGIIRITVSKMIIGLGEPYFYSTESAISQILYSIGGIKGVSFGDGFAGISLLGSSFNDPIIDRNGKTATNHNGGINGGITNGNDLIINIFIKPTPSIYKEQATFDFATNEVKPLCISGRHDSCIARRAMVVCENAVAIALCDLFLIHRAYTK